MSEKRVIINFKAGDSFRSACGFRIIEYGTTIDGEEAVLTEANPNMLTCSFCELRIRCKKMLTKAEDVSNFSSN